MENIALKKKKRSPPEKAQDLESTNSKEKN